MHREVLETVEDVGLSVVSLVFFKIQWAELITGSSELWRWVWAVAGFLQELWDDGCTISMIFVLKFPATLSSRPGKCKVPSG